MKVERKIYEQHPEGWFLFLLGEPEETTAEWKGKVSNRLKWPCTSMSVKGEDGESLVVNLFTGVDVTTHPADTHAALVKDGFEIDIDDYDDTDLIVGKMFAGKVEHKKETGRANIVKFDTPARVKPIGKSGLPKPKGAKEFNDPFAEE